MRCVRSDWIRSEERRRRPNHESDQKSCCVGEHRGQTHVWSADYHVKRNNVVVQHKSIWTLSLQFLPAITKDWDFALNLFILVVRKCNFLIAFLFYFILFIYYYFLFIIVFDASYMLLPLNVLCSKIEVSKDFARFPVFTVQTLVENLLVCGVLSSSHRGTPHTIGAKRFNLGFFGPHVCGLSHLEDLIRFSKSFSVYPALVIVYNTTNSLTIVKQAFILAIGSQR